MLAVTGHTWTQGLDITTGRLRALRRGRNPDQAPPWLEHGVGPELDLAADRVEHHVTIGNSRGEIDRVVVDHAVRAETAYVVVVASARRRDYRGAHMLGELDGEAGHTTRAALDQNGFAGFELRRILEGPQCGEAGQRHGGCFGMAEAVGLLGN